MPLGSCQFSGRQSMRLRTWFLRRFFSSQLQPNESTDQRNQQKDREDTTAKQQIKTLQLGIRGWHKILASSFFLGGLSFIALRRRIVRLATWCTSLRCLILREFARDHRNDTAVHWVDHQQFVFKLDEVVLLEDRLLVDERSGHRVELELRGDLGSNLGFKVVRSLLGAVRSY